MTPERYVIYPLGSDDIITHTPWKDNCKLLVLPPVSGSSQHDSPNELSPRMIEEIGTYVQSGGAIFSLHSQFNAFFDTFLSISNNSDSKTADLCVVEVCQGEEKYQFSCVLPDSGNNYDFEGVYLNIPLAELIVSNTDMAFSVKSLKCVKSNYNQSNNSLENVADIIPSQSESEHSRTPCVCNVVLKDKGRVVLSSVDMLPVIPTKLELEMLMDISRGVAQRKQLLSCILNWFGMECSKEKLPDLTHTFLLCSEKVS